MPTTLRKLLTRVDHENYVRILEDRLSGLGVDVDALRSPIDNHRVCIVQYDDRTDAELGPLFTGMIQRNKRFCERDPACHYVRVEKMEQPAYWAKVTI